MAWLPNTVLPVSANLNTQFLFEANFEQVSLPVDGNFLTSMLTRLLGYAPSSAIQFRLSPIPEVFQPTWHEIINLKCRLPDDAPMAARTALQEFVALSLLTWLPHNFSELLKRPPGAVTESKTVRLLRDADDYIMQNQSDSALTVSEVAAKVGVGVRSLEQIFRIHKQTTPQAYIRSLRLQAVRQILQENPSPDSLSISQIAMENGFFHLGRFAHYYKNSFGESPRQTVAKRRNRD